MTKKRKSRGRRKGSKGSESMVQCCGCGKMVPRSKAKKMTKRVSFIEPSLAKELRDKGAYLGGASSVRYYCISCAVHRGISSPRAKSDRRKIERRRR